VVVAGLRELVSSGRIKRDESIVICITGNGLKTTELFNGENRRIRLTHARSEDFEQVFSSISLPLRGRVGVGAS
jgi:threonine synthase